MGRRILVIDDDEAVRRSFVLALEDTEYQVDTAETGNEGIEMQAGAYYSLIFLDLRMPGLNGVETLRELRKRDKKIPVYIVTAFHKEFFAELQMLKNDGINFELLRKPVGINDIVELATEVLQ